MERKRINIYSKVCLQCVYKDEWKEVQQSIWRAGYEFNLIRTTYDKGAHKEATELWGDENYVAFALMPNGEALTLGKAKKMFEGMKDKRVRAGKAKPIRKGNKNVQGLRKTKRPIRVDAVEDTPVEIKVETKPRQKIPKIKES